MTHMQDDLFVGRQPIFDNNLELVAYELLFRGGRDHTQANIDNADAATSQVILNTFLEIGLDNIVGKHYAFINLTRSFITGHFQLPFETDRVVLEVLEDIDIDAEVIQGVKALAARGFQIALDDFLYDEDRHKDIVPLANIIKIDLLAQDRETLDRHVGILREKRVKLLAEKVETEEEFEHCKALGFDFYQGYLFAKPSMVSGKRAPTSRLAIMDLLGRLQNPAITIDELEEQISQDVSLSYKILHYINSSFFALRRKIDSLHQALVLLGLDNVRNWVSLIALSGIDGKPAYMLNETILRAKMAELLASAAGRQAAERYFTVGLFSSLERLLDTPMPEILKDLPLSSELQQALLQHEGDLGAALECVLAYERGDFDAVSYAGLSATQIKQAYLDALTWAMESMQAIGIGD